MSLGRFVAGLLLAAVTVGPILAGSLRLRARLFPAWSDAPARVVEAVLTAGLLVVALELAGAIGALTLLGAIASCLGVGGIAWVASGRISARERVGGESSPEGPRRSARTLAVVAVAVVAAPWLGWVIFAYSHGMETVDTLWYHLPFAARFVQSASIVHLHYVDSQPVTVFYPANSELFHALGLLLFRSDLLSPSIDLGWAALALTAAWSNGRPYGREPHCLIAAVLVLATPGLVDTQPGGAYNDVVDVALLLSCAAILINGGLSLPACAVASVAAGLALGTKYTMIVPALALGVGIAASSPRGARIRSGAVWLGGLVVFGGFWYLRNAVQVGNPLPSLALHLGPLSLPSAGGASATFTVGQYLTEAHVWSAYYLPGLRQSLGLAWPAIIAAALFGSVAAVLARGDRVRRMLGAVALLSTVAFLFTPQFLGGPGAPVFFAVNVRYLAGALALGLVLIPILPAFRPELAAAGWLLAAAVVLLATELDPAIWPTGIGVSRLADPIRGSSAAAGAALAAALGGLSIAWLNRGRRRPRSSPRVVGLIATSAVAATAAGGWLVASSYAHRRYLDTPVAPAVYRWARSIHQARIGIVGITTQYPFYGSDASNYVQYVGASEPHRGFAPIRDCRDWRRAVDRGRYQWLVLAPLGFPSNFFARVALEVAWSEQTGATSEVLRELAGGPGADTVVVVRLTGRLDPGSCPAGS